MPLAAERFTYQSLNRRTIAVIQKKIVKQGNRNVASRLFYAKRDKDQIVGWKLDFIRILQVFHVRSIGSARNPLAHRHISERAGDGYS